MELKNIEFYGTPGGDVMISQDGEPLRIYVQSDSEFTNVMLDPINEFYPEAFTALSKAYIRSKPNQQYHAYLMAHRFIRCNFRVYDERPDIDANGVFRFEFVPCPLRGECPYCGIICNPRFNHKLSDRELQVMRMIYNSSSLEEISEQLYISILTVKKHKRNALVRLKLHSVSEFISYASKNKLFENE